MSLAGAQPPLNQHWSLSERRNKIQFSNTTVRGLHRAPALQRRERNLRGMSTRRSDTNNQPRIFVGMVNAAVECPQSHKCGKETQICLFGNGVRNKQAPFRNGVATRSAGAIDSVTSIDLGHQKLRSGVIVFRSFSHMSACLRFTRRVSSFLIPFL